LEFQHTDVSTSSLERRAVGEHMLRSLQNSTFTVKLKSLEKCIRGYLLTQLLLKNAFFENEKLIFRNLYRKRGKFQTKFYQPYKHSFPSENTILMNIFFR